MSTPNSAPSPYIGAIPTVDLLPPEVKKAASDSQTRGVLILLLILLVVLALGATVGAYYLAEQQSALLRSAEREQALLQEDISQYADIPVITGMVDAVDEAKQVTTSGRLIWQDLFTSVQSVTPSGVRFAATQADTGSPTEAYPGSGNVLSGTDVIGLIQIEASAASLVDVAQWQRDLLRLPGVANAVVRQVESSDGTGWSFDVTVEFDSTRFAPIASEDTE